MAYPAPFDSFPAALKSPQEEKIPGEDEREVRIRFLFSFIKLCLEYKLSNFITFQYNPDTKYTLEYTGPYTSDHFI